MPGEKYYLCYLSPDQKTGISSSQTIERYVLKDITMSMHVCVLVRACVRLRMKLREREREQDGGGGRKDTCVIFSHYI